VIVATADDLPIGAAVCGANRQDASLTGSTLASVVIPTPAKGALEPPVPPGRRSNGKLTTCQREKLEEQLRSGCDVRAFPYLRADGNFAKIPAQLQGKREGFRLWAPRPGQSRRGLGRIRSSVERAHALLNQFGRIFRRWDRDDRRYLGWIQLACCVIFMRQGFFP
jgi:hypothetical protein